MKKKTVLTIIGCVFALGAVACIVRLAMILYQPKAVKTETMSTSSETTEETAYTAPDESQAVIPTYSSIETEPYQAEYHCPVDFDALQGFNEDIYAWIIIKDTNINYPVVQAPNNDKFYLTHNSDEEYSSAGAIFSEHVYNSRDFNDPVTILYGHHMQSGAMFGNLQNYCTTDEFWDGEPVIKIYLPDRMLKYQVFAAVPYSRYHILVYNDFSNEEVYTKFFDDIMSTHSMEARFHEEYAPVFGDKVVILSTCLIGNNSNRYIVLGKLVYDSSEQC
ncbi:class B sortase [Butyrivibrio sp. AE2032]|uniref:class B sortase n=1 Tax=Butyrivibrio sp. AE2032 TaxID=1458463 RepID=UPI00068EC404|nr:class B sortase [Butyrivibrio sp. AE2032]